MVCQSQTPGPIHDTTHAKAEAGATALDDIVDINSDTQATWVEASM
jgi:hypothetical protein